MVVPCPVGLLAGAFRDAWHDGTAAGAAGSLPRHSENPAITGQ
jgi:hypothetical protein